MGDAGLTTQLTVYLGVECLNIQKKRIHSFGKLGFLEGFCFPTFVRYTVLWYKFGELGGCIWNTRRSGSHLGSKIQDPATYQLFETFTDTGIWYQSNLH